MTDFESTVQEVLCLDDDRRGVKCILCVNHIYLSVLHDNI